MPTLNSPDKYQPARGGHAPGHLRDAFVEAVDTYEGWNDGEAEPIVDVGHSETPVTISGICGLMWNCTDIMPSMTCQQLFDLQPAFDPSPMIRPGSTYAAGARVLKALINQAKRPAA